MKKSVKRLATRADIGILAAMTMLALLGMLLSLLPKQAGADIVVRTQDGRHMVLSLAEEGNVVIEGEGGHLTLETANGAARVTHAGCPDKLCEATGWIDKRGGSIVCLPLGIIVTIEGGEEAPYDAITR